MFAGTGSSAVEDLYVFNPPTKFLTLVKPFRNKIFEARYPLSPTPQYNHIGLLLSISHILFSSIFVATYPANAKGSLADENGGAYACSISIISYIVPPLLII